MSERIDATAPTQSADRAKDGAATARRRTGGRARRTVVLAIVVVLLGLVGVAAGIIVDRERGPQWSANTGVLIRLPSPEVLLLTGLSPTVETPDLIDAAAMAKSQAVLTRAATKLGPSSTWTDLAEQVTVEPVGSSHIIKVTATAPDRGSATRTADAVAAAYVETTQERLSKAMATLETVPRPPDPERQGGSDVTADIRSRAVVLGRAVTIAETFRTEEPIQLVPGTKTPAALGIVGLAAGALAAVILTLLRPAQGRSRHAAPPSGTRPRPPTDAGRGGTGQVATGQVGTGRLGMGNIEAARQLANANGRRPDDAVGPART